MNTDTPTTRQLVDTAELADILGVSTNTIRRWEADGHIPSIRIAGTVRYDLHAVLQAGNGHQE